MRTRRRDSRQAIETVLVSNLSKSELESRERISAMTKSALRPEVRGLVNSGTICLRSCIVIVASLSLSLSGS